MNSDLQTISPEELFGVLNRLVVEEGGAAYGSISSLGTLYQIVVAAVAIIYLVLVVRFSDVLFHLLSSLFGRREQHANEKVYSSVIYNIELLMVAVGIVLIALFAMRFSITAEGARLFMPLGLESWSLFGVVAGGVALTIAWEILLLYLIRLFVHEELLWRELVHIKLLHFSATITTITPPLLLMLLTQGVVSIVSMSVVLVLCFISLIIFAKETFSPFISHRFSLFHWILYLCTLEIFPLSLLLAPILREGV